MSAGTQLRRVLVAHVLGELHRDVPVIFEPHEVFERYIQFMPCDDCGAWPPRLMRDARVEGFASVVVVRHADTCPLLRAELKRQEDRP